jgi:hypothetical protein
LWAPSRCSPAVLVLAVPVLLLAMLGVSLSAGPPAGATATNTASRVVKAGVPPIALRGPDVATQTTSAAAQIVGLESTVASWGLSCSTTGNVDLYLGYVADALRQGNLIGARNLLQVAMSNIKTQANESLIPQSDADQFDVTGASILGGIPTDGYVPNEFGATMPISLPPDPGCPTLASADGFSTAGESAGSTANLTSSTANSPNEVGLAANDDPSCNATVEKGSEVLLAVVSIGLEAASEEAPIAGSIVSSFVEVLWPTVPGCENITWEEMRTYVTQQINQAIDQQTKDHLDAVLKGLKGVLHNYVIDLQEPTPWTPEATAQIARGFNSSLDFITAAVPSFQPATRPYVVLPEYVQVMNLLIAQLRDGINHGASFGIPPGSIDDYKTQLTTDLSQGDEYVHSQITAAEDSVEKPDKSDRHYTDKVFNIKATVDGALIPGAADPSYYWQFMNAPRTSPIPPNTRILYSPAQGCTVSPRPVTPVVTTLPLTHLTVWGNDAAVDAMQTNYGNSPNPQPRMGQPESRQSLQMADNTAPNGGSWTVGPGASSMGYITTAYGYAIGQPFSVGFIFTKDGKTTDTGLLGRRGTAANFTASFPSEVLATVTVLGTYDDFGTEVRDKYHYNSANCLVFGWRLLSSYGSPQQSVPAIWTGPSQVPGTPNQACGKPFTATAPPGYRIADVTLGGAGGGGSTYFMGAPTAGGQGAQLSAEFAIKSGQPVTFIAGCGGATPAFNRIPSSGGGGFSSGGPGGTGRSSKYANGGGGGGASALCLGDGSCSTPLAVVSGGGGAGGENDCFVDETAGNGGGGFSGSLTSSADTSVLHGSSGAEGNTATAKGGGGGTDTHPGSGGAGYSNQNGQAGSGLPGKSTGGAGANVKTGNAGGGGGGGGGGYLAGGGGGGDTCITGGGAAGGGGAGSSSVTTTDLAPGSVPQWLVGAPGGISAVTGGSVPPVTCPALGGTLTTSGCPGYISLVWLPSSAGTSAP